MNGSPLDARQSGDFIKILIICGIIIGVLALVYFLIQSFKSKHQTPEWIENQKKKPTDSKQIVLITKEAGLTKDERDLLSDICKNYIETNILYLIQDNEAFEDVFRRIYNDIAERNNDVNSVATIFSLKEKLEHSYKREIVITSTKNIQVGQTMMFADKAGVHCSAVVSNNSPDSITLSLPNNLANGKNRPDTLSRVAFTLSTKNDVTYLINARVIRYQLSSNGAMEMLISHTNDVNQLLRRQSQRIPIGTDCKYSAVKVSSKNGSQKSDVVYTPMDTKYDGFLQDISSGGCRVQSSLPIREGQYIYIEFSLQPGVMNCATGVIIRTAKDDVPGKFLLHIQFVKLDIATRNTILAMVNRFI